MHWQSLLCRQVEATRAVYVVQDVVPQGSTTERAYISRSLLCRQAESWREAIAAPWRFKTTRESANTSNALSGSVPRSSL